MINCPGPRLPAAKVHRSLDTLWSETPQRPALLSCFCCVLLPLSRSGWANPPPESRGAALLRAASRQGLLPTAFPLLRCDACAAASRRSSLFAHLWALSLAHPLTDPAWSELSGAKTPLLGAFGPATLLLLTNRGRAIARPPDGRCRDKHFREIPPWRRSFNESHPTTSLNLEGSSS